MTNFPSDAELVEAVAWDDNEDSRSHEGGRAQRPRGAAISEKNGRHLRALSLSLCVLALSCHRPMTLRSGGSGGVHLEATHAEYLEHGSCRLALVVAWEAGLSGAWARASESDAQLEVQVLVGVQYTTSEGTPKARCEGAVVVMNPVSPTRRYEASTCELEFHPLRGGKLRAWGEMPLEGDGPATGLSINGIKLAERGWLVDWVHKEGSWMSAELDDWTAACAD